ncbi:MAG: hypothetical protein ACN6OP_06805 [Pseudomonadales bacterium]
MITDASSATAGSEPDRVLFATLSTELLHPAIVCFVLRNGDLGEFGSRGWRAISFS